MPSIHIGIDTISAHMDSYAEADSTESTLYTKWEGEVGVGLHVEEFRSKGGPEH